MADSKITDLSDGGAIQDADEFVVARSGNDNKIAGSKIAAAAIVQVSKISLTSGDLTTSSTSFTDATGLTTTITTGAHRCLVMFCGTVLVQANTDVSVDLAIDGTRQGQTHGLIISGNNASNSVYYNESFTYLTDSLSAASHTFKIQWKTTSGTGTLNASTGLTPAFLIVVELGI
jgi:hypothetical protein